MLERNSTEARESDSPSLRWWLGTSGLGVVQGGVVGSILYSILNDPSEATDAELLFPFVWLTGSLTVGVALLLSSLFFKKGKYD